MSIVKTDAWRCDFTECGHVWLSKEEPTRCAKCKRRNWNKNGAIQTKTVPSGPVVAKPKKQKKENAPDLVGLSIPPELSKDSLDAMKIALEPEPERSDLFAAALKALSGPKPKVGEKCPHGWSSYLQCPECNERIL